MTFMRRPWIVASLLATAAVLAINPHARAQNADAGFPGAVTGAITNQSGSISPMGPLTSSSTSITGSPVLGSATQNNLFTNPNSLPMLYGGLGGISQSGTTGDISGLNQTQSLGLMMLMANSQAAGNAGTRPTNAPTGPMTNSRQQQPRSASARANAKTRGRTIQPGGLAARYFGRNQSSTPYPQSYYNRQSRYFP